MRHYHKTLHIYINIIKAINKNIKNKYKNNNTKNSLINHDDTLGKIELRDTNLCSVKIFWETF